jgi:hypothetical protein
MNFPELKKALFVIFSSAIIALFFFTVPLEGQSDNSYETFQSSLQSIKNAKWRLGPFKIFPSLQLNWQYDNNIYGASVERSPISDFVTTISLPFTFYLPMGNWLIFYFTESPQYVYFRELKSERSLNNSYSPGLRLLLINRFVVSGSYQYSRVKDRTQGDIDARIMQETRGYRASIFYETSRGSSLGFAWSVSKQSYEDITLPGADTSLSRTWDREWKTGAIQFNHDIFTNGNFFISLGRSDFKFTYAQGAFRDSYSYQLLSGIQFPIVGRARGGLSLGYSRFIPKEEGRRGYSGLVANTNLSLRTGRFGFSFLFRRSTPFSYGESIFFVDNWYGAGISFYLTQIARLDYNFSYGGGTYPEPITVQAPDGSLQEITRKDKYRTHTAGIVFRIIGNTGLGLTATYWERASNYYLYSTDRFAVGAAITFDF